VKSNLREWARRWHPAAKLRDGRVLWPVFDWRTVDVILDRSVEGYGHATEELKALPVEVVDVDVCRALALLRVGGHLIATTPETVDELWPALSAQVRFAAVDEETAP